MPWNAPNLNVLAAELLIEELVRSGVDCFCIAPGSRSAPLALAVARRAANKAHVHFDERGAAFFALGHARATGRPAVVITTSGTAVANLLPAVVEASMDGVPLLLLTADRPPELRAAGANQTIDQPGIFGRYIRWQFDLPCPDEKIPLATLLTTADQAVFRAQHPHPGPVHLNCMFREPLGPQPAAFPRRALLAPLASWVKTARPFTRYAVPRTSVGPAEAATLAKLFKNARSGLLVVGRLPGGQPDRALRALIRALGWPVFADVQSGLRGADIPEAITHADLLLLAPVLRERCRPDVVLHIGGGLVSRRVTDFLKESEPKDYVLVHPGPARLDPAHQVSLRVMADSETFCTALAKRLPRRAAHTSLALWRRADAVAAAVLDRHMAQAGKLGAPAIARWLATALPAGHALLLGNSMPIRNMNMFAPTVAPHRVVANRGASGIDGLIATAAGFATGASQPVTALLGDLALLHDLNSLALLAAGKQPVVLLVINNDGGGIFSFLPVAQSGAAFERFFGTPHGLTFAAAAQQFGLAYAAPATMPDLQAAYRVACAGKRPALLEVRTDRRLQHTEHMELQRELEFALARMLRSRRNG
jgi:2-succinyl-5-enolpyruvyl-6-hydroxy-3-cyclohexene-1-carboxylate synthase